MEAPVNANEHLAELVKLSIDGREILAKPGQTILQTALANDIYIPSLCWHPKLDPIGACRVCLVRVDGQERLVASCQVKVREGMRVETNDPEIVVARKKALAYSLVDHPLDCGMCDKSGECDLQDTTVELGIEEPVYPSLGYDKGIDRLSPLIELMNTRCIACGRCVQICQQIQGARAIDYKVHQGFHTVVGPTSDDGFACESCGQCITVCPCGVILDLTFKHSARSFQLTKHQAVCPYCSLGCLLELNQHDNKLVRVTPLDREWLNQGYLCVLGRFGWDTGIATLHTEQRAAGESSSKPCAEPSAIALRLKQISDKYGAKAIAVFATDQFYNEDYLFLQSFTRECLGSPNLYLLGQEWHAAAQKTLLDAFGTIASPASLEQLRTADCILTVNSDMVEAFPVAALELLAARLTRKATLVSVGYRANKLLEGSDIVLRNKPGTDYALLLALLAKVVASAQNADSRLFANWQKDLERLGKLTGPQYAEATGVPSALIEQATTALMQASQPLVVLSLSGLAEGFDVPRVQTALYLARLLQKDRTSNPPLLVLMNGGNVQGALDQGIHAQSGPEHKALAEPDRGKEYRQILTALDEQQIKAVVLLGEGLAETLETFGCDRGCLDHLEYLVVLNPYPAPETSLAHDLVPVTAWAQTPGTRTTIYRQLVQSTRAVRPPSELSSAAEVLTAMIETLAGTRSEAGPGLKPQLYAASGLKADSGAAWNWTEPLELPKLSLPRHAPTQNEVSPEFPYLLTVNRFLGDAPPLSDHSANATPVLNRGRVAIARADALKLGITSGAGLLLRSPTGTVRATALVAEDLPAGVVSTYDRNLWRALIGPIDLEKWAIDERLPLFYVELSVFGAAR